MFLYLETLKTGNFGIGICPGETNGSGEKKKMARSFFYLQLCFHFLTDGWHLFKAFMLLFMSLAIVTYKPIFGYFDIILFSMTWGIVFEVCYTKILIK
jgi:hypothetical protein